MALIRTGIAQIRYPVEYRQRRRRRTPHVIELARPMRAASYESARDDALGSLGLLASERRAVGRNQLSAWTTSVLRIRELCRACFSCNLASIVLPTWILPPTLVGACRNGSGQRIGRPRV